MEKMYFAMQLLSSTVFLLVGLLPIIFAKEQVRVDVYYESLCPDSKEFMITQLYPTIIKDFSNDVNLTLYPFGKSSFRFTNKYLFLCDHGPEECRGNKIHACSLRLIDNGNNTAGHGYNNQSFGMVKCLMERVKWNTVVADFHVEQCAQDNKVTIADKIKECSNSSQGDDFLASIGHLTDSLNPKLQSVPLIIFNGRNDANVSQGAYKNFKAVLCDQFKEDKPDTCAGSITAPRLVMLLVVLMPFLSLVNR